MTTLHRDDVVRIVGPLDDDKLAAIIGSGASAEDVTEAFAWINAEDDVLKRPLAGTVARVHEILTADDWDEDAPPQ